MICYEIGHGFGLPHRDKDIYNEDLGSCLDYSSWPENNLEPDTADRQNIANMYGQLPPSPERSSKEGRIRKHELDEGWIPSNRRKISLRAAVISGGSLDHGWLFQTVLTIQSKQKRRILHQSSFGEAYEIDLGNGIRKRVQVLFQSA